MNVQLPRKSMRTIDGRIIMTSQMRLRDAVSPRHLSIDERGMWVNFRLPLQEIPGAADTVWTDWAPSNHSEKELPYDQVFQIRYRVQFEPEG